MTDRVNSNDLEQVLRIKCADTREPLLVTQFFNGSGPGRKAVDKSHVHPGLSKPPCLLDLTKDREDKAGALGREKYPVGDETYRYK